MPAHQKLYASKTRRDFIREQRPGFRTRATASGDQLKAMNPPDRPHSALAFRLVLLAILVAGAAVVAVQHLAARPDVGGFDARGMGETEASMWRSYYEGRWLTLAGQTLQASCGQCGFSWWDGARLASHAALAAHYFRKQTDDPRCISQLQSYYTIMRRGIKADADTAEMAHLELEWWKERRRNLPPSEYARTIARLTGLIYGIDSDRALPAARLRAEAMAYRDARRDGRMTESDWSEVASQLTAAYTALKSEIMTGR